MMDLNERIKGQLSEFPLLLYMKGTPDFPQCGFSAKVCGILKASEKRFAFVNILEDHEIREVGGCDIIEQMFESGELGKILDTVE